MCIRDRLFIGLLCGRNGAGTLPFVGTFAVSKIGAGGIVTVTGRLFGKCRGTAIGADSASVFPGFAGALSVIWVVLDVTLGMAVVDWGDGSFGLSMMGDVTGAVGICVSGAKTTAMA